MIVIGGYSADDVLMFEVAIFRRGCSVLTHFFIVENTIVFAGLVVTSNEFVWRLPIM